MSTNPYEFRKILEAEGPGRTAEDPGIPLSQKNPLEFLGIHKDLGTVRQGVRLSGYMEYFSELLWDGFCSNPIRALCFSTCC